MLLDQVPPNYSKNDFESVKSELVWKLENWNGGRLDRLQVMMMMMMTLTVMMMTLRVMMMTMMMIILMMIMIILSQFSFLVPGSCDPPWSSAALSHWQ